MDLAADEYKAVYSMKARDRSTGRPSRSQKKCPGHKNRKGSKCCRKKRDLAQLQESLSTNCCACCCVLAAYIKEAGKLIASCLNECPTETRLCELFTQLATVSWCVATDCCELLRHLFRLLCVIKK